MNRFPVVINRDFPLVFWFRLLPETRVFHLSSSFNMSRFPVVISRDFPLGFGFGLLAETSRGIFCPEWSHFGRPRRKISLRGHILGTPVAWKKSPQRGHILGALGKISLTGHILSTPGEKQKKCEKGGKNIKKIEKGGKQKIWENSTKRRESRKKG